MRSSCAPICASMCSSLGFPATTFFPAAAFFIPLALDMAALTVSVNPSLTVDFGFLMSCAWICSDESLLSSVSSCRCSALRVTLAVAARFPSVETSFLRSDTLVCCLPTMSSALDLVFDPFLNPLFRFSALESSSVASSSCSTLFCSVSLATRSFAISWLTVASSALTPPSFCTSSPARGPWPDENTAAMTTTSTNALDATTARRRLGA
mmetsp:Transcript_14628/g.35310  ORF Transcript_14628/g.35310 Transcript_14628/m.35310 type:complete len:209 (+) Transcript_14628:416-1042(+)